MFIYSICNESDNDIYLFILLVSKATMIYLFILLVSKATDGMDNSKEAASGGGFYHKPGSGKDKRTLQSVKTHFYVGTEVLEPL